MCSDDVVHDRVQSITDDVAHDRVQTITDQRDGNSFGSVVVNCRPNVMTGSNLEETDLAEITVVIH